MAIGATYPGLSGIISASYTLGHGIAPGVATVECAPVRSFPSLVGPLTLFGGGGSVTFPDMRIDSYRYRRSKQGTRMVVTLLDKRWRWAYGALFGGYNRPEADGSILPDTERTPQELATLCLQAMGETRFAVGDLPNGARPHVEWEGANPAQELHRLVTSLGCRVVMDVNGLVSIRRSGVGIPLPSFAGRTIEDSPAIDVTERPQMLRLIGGRTRIQMDFRLRAVGRDTDGKIKPIDELSYKPANGWERESPQFMSGVQAGAARDLARETVFRYYQVYATFGNDDLVIPVELPGVGRLRVLTRRQILLENEQVAYLEDQQEDELNPFRPRKPAEVFGVYFRNDFTFQNTTSADRYIDPFTIDAAQHLVIFDRYTYKRNTQNDQIAPADLWLRTACNVRLPPPHWGWLHYTEDRVIGTLPTPPAAVHVDGIRHELELYEGLQIDNINQVREDAEEYLSAAAQQYQTTQPHERAWAGIIPLSPDGAIEQVSWQVSKAGAVTRASRHTEHDVTIPSYEERQSAILLQGRLLTELTDAARRVREREEARRR